MSKAGKKLSQASKPEPQISRIKYLESTSEGERLSMRGTHDSFTGDDNDDAAYALIRDVLAY